MTSDGVLLASRDLDDALGLFESVTANFHDNRTGLSDINGIWVQRAMSKTPYQRIILDMDSFESLVYGEQEGFAYNGHFECTCFHPLYCFNQFGYCEGVMHRPDNVHNADRWKEILELIVQRYEHKNIMKYFRGDATFAKPEIYEYLVKHGFLSAIRLPVKVLFYKEIQHMLNRPVGRPPRKPIVCLYNFMYQVASWTLSSPVVAKVEWHEGELFPRVGFIVTNMSAKEKGVVHFYNGRGTAEQWIKEGKYALHWTRLSYKCFVSNQIRLRLFFLAYNLGNSFDGWFFL